MKVVKLSDQELPEQLEVFRRCATWPKVFVIGLDENDEFVTDTNIEDGADILWLLETTKLKLKEAMKCQL